MNLSEFFSLNREKIRHYNKLQFLVSLILQLIFPFQKVISYDSYGKSTLRRVHLICYFQTDTNTIVIPFIFLIFLIMTIYFYFIQTETKYFDFMPLALTPILGYSIFSWLDTLTHPITLPRTETYIELGLIILGISIIIYYIFYFYDRISEGVINSKSEKDKFNTNNNTPASRLEERCIGFLLCFSVLPIAVTIPALGIFATHFINTEEVAFFTAYGFPLLLPESYIYYRISSIIGDIIYNPIFFSLISLVLFCTSIFAIRSISKRSTIQISEIIFIITTLGFLFLINSLLIFSLYLVFPWFIIPFWMIYDSKKDPKRLKNGITLIIVILGTGIIIVFVQNLIPIDFGLMTAAIGLDQIKMRPTFILLALPYLIHRIHQGSVGE